MANILLQWAELSNLATHITLRNLRPAGTRRRAIPFGYGFDLVSCPNYFFETIGWTVVCFLSTSWSGKNLYLKLCMKRRSNSNKGY